MLPFFAVPIKPKVGIPKGENSKIVLTWNSPRNTLIQIEGYEIQWSIDEWLTIADRKNVAFNVFRHEIETATEGVTYRVEICSFSNSVKSLYEAFQPFATRRKIKLNSLLLFCNLCIPKSIQI